MYKIVNDIENKLLKKHIDKNNVLNIFIILFDKYFLSG